MPEDQRAQNQILSSSFENQPIQNACYYVTIELYLKPKPIRNFISYFWFSPCRVKTGDNIERVFDTFSIRFGTYAFLLYLHITLGLTCNLSHNEILAFFTAQYPITASF